VQPLFIIKHSFDTKKQSKHIQVVIN